jgi:hypothetical protein
MLHKGRTVLNSVFLDLAAAGWRTAEDSPVRRAKSTRGWVRETAELFVLCTFTERPGFEDSNLIRRNLQDFDALIYVEILFFRRTPQRIPLFAKISTKTIEMVRFL